MFLTRAAACVAAVFVSTWGISPAHAAPAAQDPAPATLPAAAQPARPPIYDEAADGKEQIAAALARAQKENRRVLIQWGANWCSWCHLLHETFEKSRSVSRTLRYEYDVVLIDIGRWDKHLDLAEKYGADFKSAGVPYLTILDAEGNVLANQETASLEAKIEGRDGHDPEKVNAFLQKHQAPYLKAGAVLESAMSEAARSGRRIFVHFGAPWCGWCHRLEGWLARPEIARLIEKDFVEVKIDTDRMIGGAELLTGYRESKSGGIPWFAFLSPEGKKIATSEGPKGNIGCPFTDEEIDAFGEILRQARQSLTDEEIGELLTSLRQSREAK